MIEARLTAIVRLTYAATEEMSLDREREYDTLVEVGGKVVPSNRFKSPIGDERWRETVRTIRTSTENRDRDRGPQAGLVAGVGHDLFLALAGLAPELADFLVAKTRRRLVIMSMRPEIHALPWEALSDRRLESVAVSDLSIVRCTQVFEPKPYPSPPLVRICSKFGPDTNDDVLRSARSVRVSNVSGRPVGVEITAQASDAEIVNLVAHGSEKDEHRAQTLVDQDRSLSPEQLAAQYQERLMVLMWSCFSAMVHSWGASPTLALHAAGNVFVLGFVAPLSLKASADIAKKFYDSVFGAAGSQDPERAITEISGMAVQTPERVLRLGLDDAVASPATRPVSAAARYGSRSGGRLERHGGRGAPAAPRRARQGRGAWRRAAPARPRGQLRRFLTT